MRLRRRCDDVIRKRGHQTCRDRDHCCDPK